MLEKAIEIAVQAHKGQKDKSGQPYILHPLRLMMQMKTETEKIVAVLHDVIEDTSVTLRDLQGMGFSEEVIKAIDCLSRREGEVYADFIENISKNKIAKTVKIADLEDNMNVRRLQGLSDNDLGRLKRYLKSWRRLQEI